MADLRNILNYLLLINMLMHTAQRKGFVLCTDLQVSATRSLLTAYGLCPTFVSSMEYNCTDFMVPTMDGFLLGVQRMSKRIYNTSLGEPVFLYHGIMEGGESWFLNERRESLAYMLMDCGYDVWIGNTRTTMFSYGHTTYNETQKEFWDWRWDDLVDFDLPAMLHFVNKITRKDILYIGYSQGSMSGFAAFTRSEIASIVKKAVMFNPVAYLEHISSPIARTAAWLFIDQVDLLLGKYEFNPSTPDGRQLLQIVCQNAGLICSDLLALVQGRSCCTNNSRTAYYDRYTQPSSIKNMAQMAQLVRSGRFGRYDYGMFGNLFKYHSLVPPSYDLSTIPERVSFFMAYGGNDMVADAEDVRHVAQQLRGEVTMFFKPNYNHRDFMLGTSAHKDVYPNVLEFLQRD